MRSDEGAIRVWSPGRDVPRRGHVDVVDALELGRSILIVQARYFGVSWRHLGLFFHTNEINIRRHYNRIPPETRAMYLETPLDIPSIFGIS
jgi:hypothetical protein